MRGNEREGATGNREWATDKSFPDHGVTTGRLYTMSAERVACLLWPIIHLVGNPVKQRLIHRNAELGENRSDLQGEQVARLVAGEG